MSPIQRQRFNTCLCTTHPVIENVARSPVIEYISRAPSVTHVTPGEQFSPACTTEAVTTGVTSDTTGLVNPLCAITAVEASAPQVVASLPPLDEFAAPVHQEQIVAEETTQNFGRIPKECVAPAPAATEKDAWVESLCSLHDVPLAERLRLKREAEAKSAERAAAELLSEDVAAGAPSSAPSSPAVKEGRHKK